MANTKALEPVAPQNLAAAVVLADAFGANLTAAGLEITDPDLSYDQWENLGRVIGFAGNAWQWWAGDWINIGETLYGEQAAQAMDDKATRYDIVRRTIGKEQQTLLNISSVCRKVKRGTRRIELSFGHHSVVAPLEPEEQAEWLGRAIESQWSIADLREAIREAKGLTATDDGSGGGSQNMTRCQQIEEAASYVLNHGQATSDGSFLVPPEGRARLAAALGEE